MSASSGGVNTATTAGASVASTSSERLEERETIGDYVREKEKEKREGNSQQQQQQQQQQQSDL
jgi:hypothetical protein